MQKLWLYLYFPNLQLDALRQQDQNGSCNEQAYVILDEQANQVCQLNQTAYQAGIRLGMGLGTAAMLKGDLQVLPYQQKITDSILHTIAQNLYLVTSDICFFESDSLLLQVHNMLSLYDGLPSYWQVIQHQLNTHRVQFNYATGHSPLAAKILANITWNKVSSDIHEHKKTIQNIDLEHSDITPKDIKKLHRVGIHNIKSLLGIPLPDIATRFDISVATYIGRLTGELPHPVKFFHPKQDFDSYVELLYDIESTQVLQTPLMQLLQKLEAFLKQRDLLSQTLIIILSQRDKKPIMLKVAAQQGEYLATSWATLINLKFENIQLDAPVFAIQLVAKDTFIRSPDKQDLFAGKQGAVTRLQLLSLLQAKLGEAAIYRPLLDDDFRPERMLKRSRLFISTTKPFKLHALRPSFLITPPQRLLEKVSIAYGPERIETGWWDEQAITRDYFIARNQHSQWYWVFKTREGDWYLHGIFS